MDEVLVSTGHFPVAGGRRLILKRSQKKLSGWLSSVSIMSLSRNMLDLPLTEYEESLRQCPSSYVCHGGIDGNFEPFLVQTEYPNIEEQDGHLDKPMRERICEGKEKPDLRPLAIVRVSVASCFLPSRSYSPTLGQWRVHVSQAQTSPLHLVSRCNCQHDDADIH
jgi:hypothetical protein